jgi:hypothetical protein
MRIAVKCRALRGAISRSIAWSASFVSAEVRFQKTEDTRSSSSPERSWASMVLAKVGGSGSAATASISAAWRAKASSKAGVKCSGAISAKGGMPKGVVQAASSGFVVIDGSNRDGGGSQRSAASATAIPAARRALLWMSATLASSERPPVSRTTRSRR